jgi:hypothetical protein
MWDMIVRNSQSSRRCVSGGLAAFLAAGALLIPLVTAESAQAVGSGSASSGRTSPSNSGTQKGGTSGSTARLLNVDGGSQHHEGTHAPVVRRTTVPQRKDSFFSRLLTRLNNSAVDPGTTFRVGYSGDIEIIHAPRPVTRPVPVRTISKEQLATAASQNRAANFHYVVEPDGTIGVYPEG